MAPEGMAGLEGLTASMAARSGGPAGVGEAGPESVLEEEEEMVRLTVMYPGSFEGGTFDHEYYRTTHRNLVLEKLTPLGLRAVEINRGIASGDGGPAPLVAAGHILFDSLEALQAALEVAGAAVLGDIPNFTNIPPTIQISEVVG